MPLSPQQIQMLLASSGPMPPFAPYRASAPPTAGGPLRAPGDMPATTGRPEVGGLAGLIPSQKTLYALGLTDISQDPAAAREPEVTPEENLATLEQFREPAPPPVEEPVGELPRQIEQPGDVQRAMTEKKLTQLENLRAIAEGLGQPVRVKGEITQRTGRPQPFIAEGIRGAIGREEKKLGELDAADKLRLKAELEGQLMDKEAAQRSAQQAGGRQLKAGDLKAFEGYQSFLTTSQDLLADSERMAGSLGPLDNLLDTAAEKLGWSSPEVAEFRRKATSQLNLYIREMTGAQMSEKEAERILRGAPKLSDTQKVFQEKMRGTIQEVKQKHNTWIENRRTLGYDVPFGTRVGGEGGGMVSFRHPTTGQVEQVPAERADEVEAQSGGWVRVDNATT